MNRWALCSCFIFAISIGAVCQVNTTPIGLFDGHLDVGSVLHPGSTSFDAAKQTYTVAGSGENMWFAADAFQFVWTKVSGDVTLTADISFLTTTGNEHKKAVLMLRQSLDADSVYADVALHASGLTSLQFRDAKGAATHEVQANVSAPKRLQLLKRGKYALMYLAAQGDELRFSGAAVRLITERDQGRAIMLVSLELEEILSLSDRILVIYEGQIVGEHSGDVSEEQIGLEMLGGSREAA